MTSFQPPTLHASPKSQPALVPDRAIPDELLGEGDEPEEREIDEDVAREPLGEGRGRRGSGGLARRRSFRARV